MLLLFHIFLYGGGVSLARQKIVELALRTDENYANVARLQRPFREALNGPTELGHVEVCYLRFSRIKKHITVVALKRIHLFQRFLLFFSVAALGDIVSLSEHTDPQKTRSVYYD